MTIETEHHSSMFDHLNRVIESDYLETTEGLFFAVKGMVHPADRTLACLRYAPDPGGERRKDGRAYRRLYHFAEQEQFLQAQHPQYLAYDPCCRVVLQSVPHASVERIYTPRRRLQAIARRPEPDPLEADTLAFAVLLQQTSGVPLECLGVSGSTLIGLHTPASDLDMTVHGAANCHRLRRALRALLDSETGEARRLDLQGMQALYAERSADTRMEFADFLRSENKKVIQGSFRGRIYFIRFLKDVDEFGEQYGERSYTPLECARIEATVTDDREAIFTPCRYPLAEVRFLHGPQAAEPPREIVSFRGRFCEQAETGDRIQAYGMLERVEERSGDAWYRLLLGSGSDDTLFLRR